MGRHWVLGLALFAGACGGGDSSPRPVATATPAPVPAPSPSPTPTPTPTPGVAFVASAGAPLIGGVLFDADGDGKPSDDDIQTQTNRRGEFGLGAVGRMSPVPPPAQANFAASLSGISADTGFRYSQLDVPAGVVAFSPVTMLSRPADHHIVSQNLGLGLTATELAQFDSFRAMESSDQQRRALGLAVTALNLKLLAIAGYETLDSAYSTGFFRISRGSRIVRAEVLTQALDLNSASSQRHVIDRSERYAGSSPDARDAAAQLLARYGAAVDQYLTGPDDIAAIEYALRVRLVHELRELAGESSAQIAHANTIATADIVQWFRDFEAVPRPDTRTANLIAVVDTREISGPTRITLATACGDGATSALTCNDGFVDPRGTINISELRVSAVRMPSRFSGVLGVRLLADGGVQLDRLTDDYGLAWFDYDIVSPDGSTASSRCYVYLNSLR